MSFQCLNVDSNLNSGFFDQEPQTFDELLYEIDQLLLIAEASKDIQPRFTNIPKTEIFLPAKNPDNKAR